VRISVMKKAGTMDFSSVTWQALPSNAQHRVPFWGGDAQSPVTRTR
jgi:hypothetical protein